MMIKRRFYFNSFFIDHLERFFLSINKMVRDWCDQAQFVPFEQLRDKSCFAPCSSLLIKFIVAPLAGIVLFLLKTFVMIRHTTVGANCFGKYPKLAYWTNLKIGTAERKPSLSKCFHSWVRTLFWNYWAIERTDTIWRWNIF